MRSSDAHRSEDMRRGSHRQLRRGHQPRQQHRADGEAGRQRIQRRRWPQSRPLAHRDPEAERRADSHAAAAAHERGATGGRRRKRPRAQARVEDACRTARASEADQSSGSKPEGQGAPAVRAVSRRAARHCPTSTPLPLRLLPGFRPGAADTAAVVAEMRAGETFSSCATRLGMLPAGGHARRTGPPGDDLCGDAAVSGVCFDFEHELEARQAEEDDALRRARMQRRRASERGAAEARGRGEAFSASYARKVDGYGNSTAVVCMKWLEGLCIYGDMCPELHTLDGAYLPPCSFFFKNGFCAKKTCPYKHLETERQHYHCDEHLRGLECPRGRACPDMHKRSRFGTVRDACGPIPKERRAAAPQEMCMVSTQSMAFTPRDVHPRNSVNLNRLVHGSVVEQRERAHMQVDGNDGRGDGAGPRSGAGRDARARRGRRDCRAENHLRRHSRGGQLYLQRQRQRQPSRDYGGSDRSSHGGDSRRRDVRPSGRG